MPYYAVTYILLNRSKVTIQTPIWFFIVCVCVCVCVERRLSHYRSTMTQLALMQSFPSQSLVFVCPLKNFHWHFLTSHPVIFSSLQSSLTSTRTHRSPWRLTNHLQPNISTKKNDWCNYRFASQSKTDTLIIKLWNHWNIPYELSKWVKTEYTTQPKSFKKTDLRTSIYQQCELTLFE